MRLVPRASIVSSALAMTLACAPAAQNPPQGSATPPGPQTQPASAGAARTSLAGTAWQLVKFQGSDDKTLTPDDRSKYTVAFGTDGAVSARFDSNRGRGKWTSPDGVQLELGPLELTRAMCPQGSLHDRLVKDWSYVRSYVIKDGHLFLSLMADGGIYEFEPIPPSKQPDPTS